MERKLQVDLKLYALELLVEVARMTKRLSALEGGGLEYSLLDELRYKDPFFDNGREVFLDGRESFGASRQIAMPILVSRFLNGETKVVFLSRFEETSVR